MKNILLTVLVLPLIAWSCVREPAVAPSSVDQLSIMSSVESSGEIWVDLADPSGKFSISAVATRINVTNNVFETSDKIGLYVAEWQGASASTQVKTNLEPSGNQTDNHRYTYSATGTWTAPALANPLTWRKVSVFAYHPYSTPQADALNVPFIVREDQTSGISSLDYLMWGRGVSNDAGYTPATDIDPIVLGFEHKLAHVALDVTLPALFNGVAITSIDAAYVLGVPVSGGKLNMQNGVYTVSAAAADIKPVKMFKEAAGADLKVGKFSAVVAPCAAVAGREVIKIDYTGVPTSGSLYFYAGDAGFNFFANKLYKITLSTDEFGFAADLPVLSGDVETNTQVFTVRSSGADTWTVTSGDPAWITVGEDVVSPAWAGTITGVGEKICRIKVLKNTTGQSRMNKLILSKAGKTNVELVVFQQKNTL